MGLLAGDPHPPERPQGGAAVEELHNQAGSTSG
jgi:hypothetical protein